MEHLKKITQKPQICKFIKKFIKVFLRTFYLTLLWAGMSVKGADW